MKASTPPSPPPPTPPPTCSASTAPTRANFVVLLAAAEDVEENTRFAARVRAAYDLLPAKTTRASGSSYRQSGKTDAHKILTSALTPIHHIEGREINLAAPLDPCFLRNLRLPPAPRRP